MKRRSVQKAYEPIRPDAEARDRMLKNILLSSEIPPAGKDERLMRRKMKPLVIAAIIALMILMMGCAIVALNLGDMKLAEENRTDGYSQQEKVENIVSLQGFVGSKNYQAAKEWYDFLQSYDPDYRILQSLSNAETMMPEEYWSYNCYTTEMAEKVDEICEKYGLQKQGMAKLFDSVEYFYGTLNISGLIHPDAEAEARIEPSYYYQTGSFMLDCEMKLTGSDSPWIYPIEFQMYCVMKRDFDDVYLNVGDIACYDQWEYTTKDGTEVLLAISPDKALMIVDKQEYFVTMNILNPRVGDILYGEQMMSRAAMECFADAFDYSFSPVPLTDAEWDSVQAHPTPNDIERERRKEEAMNTIGAESYAGRVQHLLDNVDGSEKLGYALIDVDGNGVEEMLIGQNQRIYYLYTFNGASAEHLLENVVLHFIVPFGQEEATGTTAASYMYLCEGNAVACVYEEIDGSTTHHFARAEGGKMVWADEIEADSAGYYQLTSDGNIYKDYNDIRTSITEDSYLEVLNSYSVKSIDWMPLTEYPIN